MHSFYFGATADSAALGESRYQLLVGRCNIGAASGWPGLVVQHITYGTSDIFRMAVTKTSLYDFT